MVGNISWGERMPLRVSVFIDYHVLEESDFRTVRDDRNYLLS
jgi:hypothetical protein